MAAAAGKAPRDVVVVALVTALCLTGDSMLYIALPIYWREAGLDALWQVGVLLAVNRFIRLPFNPLIGALYARISLNTGLLLAVVLGIVTITGYALASGFLAWLAAAATYSEHRSCTARTSEHHRCQLRTSHRRVQLRRCTATSLVLDTQSTMTDVVAA